MLNFSNFFTASIIDFDAMPISSLVVVLHNPILMLEKALLSSYPNDLRTCEGLTVSVLHAELADIAIIFLTSLHLGLSFF